MAEDCLFCAIVAGRIPSTKVLETERAYAFRDLNPWAPTHVLVVPKDHHADLAALAAADPAYLGEIFAAAAEVAEQEGLTGGHRIIANTGPDSGQTVLHLHIHVLGGKNLGALAG